jgi:hypothetical protein
LTFAIGNPPYVRADEQSDENKRLRELILLSRQYEKKSVRKAPWFVRSPYEGEMLDWITIAWWIASSANLAASLQSM